MKNNIFTFLLCLVPSMLLSGYILSTTKGFTWLSFVLVTIFFQIVFFICAKYEQKIKRNFKNKY